MLTPAVASLIRLVLGNGLRAAALRREILPAGQSRRDKASDMWRYSARRSKEINLTISLMEILVALCSVLLCGCSFCHSSPWSIVPAPDKTQKAVIYERTCGRGQPMVEVSVLPATRKIEARPGNIASFAWQPGIEPLEGPAVVWDSAKSIVVSFWASNFSLSRKSEAAGVKAEFIVSTPQKLEPKDR